MSLATIVSNVAAECGYTVESTVTGSTETTTKQLLAMTQRINKDIFEFYPWPKCYAAGSITLVSGQATYELPAAFSWYQYETFWNSSTRWRILGPMTEQEYGEIRGFGLNTTVYQRFQIRGLSNNQLLISPTPSSSGNVIVFEYIADRCVRPVTWTASTLFAANAYCFYNGNYYQTTAGGTTGATAPTHTTGSVSDGGVTWTYYSGAYDQFIADTDVSIFNEKMVEQGVIERFAQIHGLTGVVPQFKQQVDEEFSRENPGKIYYAGGHTRAEIFARSGTAVFGTWI
jgi:hypothetical protein|tara:strand:- start:1145 stop:2002 length:858 start_codon:yes stop_codon:yes gene_type:complete